MNDRFRGLLIGLKRLLLIALGAGALVLGWKAFLHYGPGLQGGPPMYRFHAKALVKFRLAFPRPAPPVLVPVPQSMSSADVQLRLMRWWDGRGWLPEALARGDSVKEGLQLRAGELTLLEITEIGPPEAKDGVLTCRVRGKVRWDFPEELQELHRVKEIVALRFTRGPVPGQVTELACTFQRKGWRWELATVESPWGGRLFSIRPFPGRWDWVL